MSYDLMVFDQEAAPSDRSTFLNWFKEQTNWSTDLDYDDPSGTSPALNAWFFDIINSYPALNGPFRSQDEDIAGEKIGDYSIGKSFVYATFAWSDVEKTYATVFHLAKKHGLGFYDVSSDKGEVWGRASDGSYVCLHSADVVEAESLKRVRVFSITAKKILKDKT
jgi:hypothetical protein